MGAHGVVTLHEGREQRSVRPRHGARTAAGLGALVLLVFGFCLITIAHGRPNFDIYRIDLDVYRLGAHAWLSGHNLYGQLPPTRNGLDLGFTYPPISAVLMTPLAVVPARLAGILITALTLGLLMAVVALFLRTAGLADRPRSWRLAALLLPVAVLVEPVRTTLAYGQINVVLMALVSFDCLLPETWFRTPEGWPLIGGRRVGWPRGALIGVAAALKLTPAVFVLYFLAQRDRRSALRAAASFAGFTALGFAVAPGDSAQYWGHTVLATGRIGAVWYAANQSLQAVFTRAGLSGHALSVAWVLGCLVVLALAWTAMRRALAQGDAAGALIVNALAELLISPISWTHHWVWIVPALVVFGAAGRRSALPRARLFMITVFALFALGPQWLLPHSENRELRWALWEQLLGGGYVWFALAILALAALPRHRRPTPTAP
jgi:alpha-1,2-mannosyltransferase